MRTIPSRRILFVISLILCCTVCAQEEKEFNVDSELYSYFQRCQENVGDSKFFTWRIHYIGCLKKKEISACKL